MKQYTRQMYQAATEYLRVLQTGLEKRINSLPEDLRNLRHIVMDYLQAQLGYNHAGNLVLAGSNGVNVPMSPVYFARPRDEEPRRTERIYPGKDSRRPADEPERRTEGTYRRGGPGYSEESKRKGGVPLDQDKSLRRRADAESGQAKAGERTEKGYRRQDMHPAEERKRRGR